MSRTLRRWTSWIAFAAFAFSQVALAVYACPLRTPVQTPAFVADADAAGGQDRCSGHSAPAAPDTGPLCENHCESQTGAIGGTSLLVPPVVLAPFPVVVALDDEPIALARVARTPGEANAAAPPHAQRFCKLLI